MGICPLRNDDDLKRALARVDALWGSPPGGADGDELDVLLALVEHYERQHHPLPPADPIDVIEYKLHELGWSQRELGRQLGWSSGRVSEVLGRKRGLTLAMVQQLATVLALDAALLVGVERPSTGHEAGLALDAMTWTAIRAAAERDRYRITEEARLRRPRELLRALAGLRTRDASDRGHKATVKEAWFDDSVAHGLVAPTITSKFERLLLLVAQRSTFMGEAVEIEPRDGPLFGALNDLEFEKLLTARRTLGDFRDSGYTNARICELTAKGWAEVERLQQPGSGKQIFVAMWFDSQMDAAWSQGIEPAIQEVGLRPLRIEKKQHVNRIDDEIIVEIRKSRAVVADVTGQRQGVYFEAGFALGLGLQVIWCCRRDALNDVHFDTRQFNHVVWDTPEDLKKNLELRLPAVLKLP